MRILITNDDGIHSRGLEVLAEQVSCMGEVFVVVPAWEQSGTSHSMTLNEPLRLKAVRKNWYVVNGTPTDCVRLGVMKIMKEKVNMVISGINDGANLGDDTGYSGTVGGAMEGCLLGIPSFAISLVTKSGGNYEAAGRFAVELAGKLRKKKLPAKTFLNVNVPDLPYAKIKGVAVTAQGRRIYSKKITTRPDPKGKRYYWLAAERSSGWLTKGSDLEAIARKKISVTPLTLDFTNYDMIKPLKTWKL